MPHFFEVNRGYFFVEKYEGDYYSLLLFEIWIKNSTEIWCCLYVFIEAKYYLKHSFRMCAKRYDARRHCRREIF